MKLTKSAVDKIVPPPNGQKFYRDDVLKGFAVRVTAGGTKSFIVEKRINGNVRRTTLAKYPELTTKQARELAQQFLGKVASGKDPIAEKKREKVGGISLEHVFEDYLHVRDLKPNTVFDYRRVMREAFSDWQQKSITSITKDMVASRHIALGKKSHARANNAMRVLRALFNFAEANYDDGQGISIISENPTRRLTQTRAWYKVGRKQSVIKSTDIRKWFFAVKALSDGDVNSPGTIASDYLLTLLLTGLRREEAKQLRWIDIDLESKTLTVIDTKNREEHTLPLSNFLDDLFRRRKTGALSEYVFPGKDRSNHVVCIEKHKRKAAEESGIAFSHHDLRRTFITIAESLDISVYTVKRLANHKVSASDVTAGYVITETERLRDPMQKITDRILELGEISNTIQ